MSRGTAASLAAVALVSGGLIATGCPSAYDRAYDREAERLQSEQQQGDAQAAAAHAEAQKYAAVIYFDSGSAVIKRAGRRELGWFVDKMRSFPEAVIQVQGFAESTGSDALNRKLSEERAQAVAQHLATLGIASSRIVVQGFASESPAGPNETSFGRLNNRRVEADLETLPLWIREGGIVPLGPAMSYVDEIPTDAIDLRVGAWSGDGESELVVPVDGERVPVRYTARAGAHTVEVGPTSVDFRLAEPGAGALRLVRHS
jgi:outer membrane protein OmpA-like peptidoglycan-associated protein